MPTAWGMGLVLALPACSLLLNPERIDDVNRCNNADDCPASGDNRFAQACVFVEDPDADREEQGDFETFDADKVCAPVFATMTCKPTSYPQQSEYRTLYDQAQTRESLYAGTCQSFPGVQGCRPTEDGCAEGLVVDSRTGNCDDEDPLTPPALEPETFAAGWDVQDQFCRSLFCDITFVCDHAGTDTCKPCELGRDLGRGGCGDIYFEGQPSPVYQPVAELEANCAGSNVVAPDDASFGPLYQPTEGS